MHKKEVDNMSQEIYKVGKKIITSLDFKNIRSFKKSLSDVLMLQIRYEYSDDIGPQIKSVLEYESLLRIASQGFSNEEMKTYEKYKLFDDSRMKSKPELKEAHKAKDDVIKRMFLIGSMDIHKTSR